MKTKPTRGWALRSPRGQSIGIWSIRCSRREAIKSIVENTRVDWRTYYRAGWRAIRVRVSPQ